MYRLAAILALTCAPLGCGSSTVVPAPSDSAGAHAREPSAALPPPETVAQADIADFAAEKDPRKLCENVTRPGSRIVLGHRCREIDEDALEERFRDLRREQDELDRISRERERRRTF
jgi:hypothetical protein